MLSGGAALADTTATATAQNNGPATAQGGAALVTNQGGAPTAQTPAAISTLTASADATANSSVSEVVVTGSRIPRPNLSSASPIQAVSHQEFQLQGATDAVNLLDTLPQNFQNNTADFSNTSNPLTSPGGITTADLRGLGPQRTLVLVNGRRLGIGDPNTGDPNPAPDLDQIPVALIDHVEVLTGGASATYGSDAIAGVVNFVMKTDFQGIQVDGTAGIDQHTQHSGFMEGIESAAGITPPTGSVWDGANDDFSVVMGTNMPDDKGNVTGYFEFKHETPVTEGSRDFSDCLYSSAAIEPLLGGPAKAVCSGSPNSNSFTVEGPLTNPNLGLDFGAKNGTFVPWGSTTTTPPQYFNSSPFEYLSRDDSRYLGGFFAHYDIAPWVQPYMEVSYMNDQTHSAIAPSGAFEGDGPDGGDWDISCDNPLMTAQQQSTLCGPQAGTAATVPILLGRRDVEGGPRQAFFEHNNFRVVVGSKGDFGDDAWHYDAYGSYYFDSLYNANTGYFSISGIENALDVDGTAANPTCVSGGSCVPWDIFGTGAGVTKAQINYLEEEGTSHGSTTEAIWEGNLRGDLGKYGVKSPWANDGVQIDFGTQHRWDQLIFAPDQAELSGDLSGFSGASVSVNNAISVQEEYFEGRVPIAEKQPFADDLFIEGGFRYSDYSTSGGVSTYKFGGQWAPIPEVTLRGSYDRAIRAASILEAFTPLSETQTSVVGSDPCAATPSQNATATLAQCELTGVTASEYGNGISPANPGGTDHIAQCPAGQCSTETGGNANLKPEISNSYTVGILFSNLPWNWARSFTASVDYWDISIAGEIGVVPLTISLQNCLAGVDTATFCPNIVRTATGELFGNLLANGGYIAGTNQNIAASDTSGVDAQLDYRLDLEDLGAHGVGSVSFHFSGTYQVKATTTTLPGQPTFDCAGLFGPTCGTVDPKWRHTLRVTWNTPWNVLASLQWRYIGSSTLDNNSTQVALFEQFTGAVDVPDGKLPQISYLDLSGAWRATSYLTVRAGVDNILDQDPPLISQLVAGEGEPNSYPTYDLLGRQIFVSATAKF